MSQMAQGTEGTASFAEQAQQAQPQEQVAQEQTQDQSQDDFDAGFLLNEQEENKTEQLEQVEQPEKPEQKAEEKITEIQNRQQTFPQDQNAQQQANVQRQTYFNNQYTQQPPAQQQYQQQQYQQQQQQQTQQPSQQRQQVKFVQIAEDIKAEYEELKKKNPQVAYLAQTDSPIGETLRKQLLEYGADHADDMGKNFITRQKMEQQIEAQKQAQARNEYESQLRYYNSVFNQRQPEYAKLYADAQRDVNKAQELRAYQNELLSWIEAKPYKEASSMMQIALHGTDPVQVCDLISRFNEERGKKPRATKPNPTGAFAVPSRGTATPPPGIGDKDSFDSGWEINERNESKGR
ncbi:MAG: hypothetical protein IJU76_08370 [Desulfovibrionaceae bacterium]|nr:hypothetical protein [Desulfovibrionaceae bacterium]